MLRGKETFKCFDCGYKFEALDFEYCATIFSVPATCPKCSGHRTMPVAHRMFQKNYAVIWEKMSRENRL